MKKIVVINNDPDFQLLIKSYLERQGYTAININIDEPIVARLRELHPDVVILDVNVEKDVRICEAIRSDERTSAAKLVILTDESVDSSLAPCKADFVLQKPFSASNLLAEIIRM